MKKINGYYFLSLGFIVLLYLFVSHNVNNEIILPKFNSIILYLKSLSKITLFENITSTVVKSVTSYLISFIVALLLAITAFYNKFYRLINPFISILKSLPTISIILIAFISLGNEKAIYIIPIIVIIPILYETFMFHLKNIDKNLIEVCKIYQFSFLKRVRYLYFYPLLEGFMLSLKQTFGLCFKVIVMAEVIGQAQYGIGAMMQNEKANYEMQGVFAWTIILIIIVLLVDLGLDLSNKKVIKWKCYDEN